MTQLSTSAYASAACLNHGSQDITLNLTFKGHKPKRVLGAHYSWHSLDRAKEGNPSIGRWGLFKGRLDS